MLDITDDSSPISNRDKGTLLRRSLYHNKDGRSPLTIVESDYGSPLELFCTNILYLEQPWLVVYPSGVKKDQGRSMASLNPTTTVNYRDRRAIITKVSGGERC